MKVKLRGRPDLTALDLRREFWRKPMMKTVVFGCILSALLSEAPAGSAGEGKQVYDKSCRTCHGADGNGNPGVDKVMKVQFRPLGSQEVQAKTDDELKKIITQGTGKMKPVTGLSAKQMDDVVAYLRSLKK